MHINGKYVTPLATAMETLELRFDDIGLTTEDLIHLLNSGLDVAELTEYAEAIASRRIH